MKDGTLYTKIAPFDGDACKFPPRQHSVKNNSNAHCSGAAPFRSRSCQ